MKFIEQIKQAKTKDVLTPLSIVFAGAAIIYGSNKIANSNQDVGQQIQNMSQDTTEISITDDYVPAVIKNTLDINTLDITGDLQTKVSGEVGVYDSDSTKQLRDSLNDSYDTISQLEESVTQTSSTNQASPATTSSSSRGLTKQQQWKQTVDDKIFPKLAGDLMETYGITQQEAWNACNQYGWNALDKYNSSSQDLPSFSVAGHDYQLQDKKCDNCVSFQGGYIDLEDPVGKALAIQKGLIQEKSFSGQLKLSDRNLDFIEKDNNELIKDVYNKD